MEDILYLIITQYEGTIKHALAIALVSRRYYVAFERNISVLKGRRGETLNELGLNRILDKMTKKAGYIDYRDFVEKQQVDVIEGIGIIEHCLSYNTFCKYCALQTDFCGCLAVTFNYLVFDQVAVSDDWETRAITCLEI